MAKWRNSSAFWRGRAMQGAARGVAWALSPSSAAEGSDSGALAPLARSSPACGESSAMFASRRSRKEEKLSALGGPGSAAESDPRTLS